MERRRPDKRYWLVLVSIACVMLMLAVQARAETVYHHNTLNQLTQVDRDDDTIVSYEYDANGNLTGKTVYTAPTGGSVARQLFQWVPHYAETSAAELARGGINPGNNNVMAQVKDDNNPQNMEART